MAEVLNKHSIDALIVQARKSKGKQFELADHREAGLRIRAGERSTTWLLNARLKNGKRSRIKLGAWPSMGISDARKAAQVVKFDVASGSDPNEERRAALHQAAEAAANQRTLRDVLDLYQADRLSQLKRGVETRRALDGEMGLLHTLATRDPSSITRSELADLVRDQAARAPVAANRNLAYASAFFNWCLVEEIIENNPAQTIPKPTKEKPRDRCHSMGELREIWKAAETLGPPFDTLFKLLIVVPMRVSEIAEMPVSELALNSSEGDEGSVWTLAAARTKRENALRVPLPPLAKSLIMDAINAPSRPPDSPLVFTTTGDTPVSGFGRAKRRLDTAIKATREKAAKCNEVEAVMMLPWKTHDLRTTFATQACDLLGIEIQVADRILNHVASATTSKIMRVYNRSEMFEARKLAMNKWAGLVERECCE